MLGRKERSQLELFISGSQQLIPMIMYWSALIAFSIFRGCGMKSLTAIALTMVDPGSIPKGLANNAVHFPIRQISRKRLGNCDFT